jgi:antitoxin component YwqK of YwqJK toxin-antitoxin module
MKKVILLVTGLLLFSSTFSQIIIKEDGLYYDKNDKLFSGDYKEYYDNGQVRQEMTVLNGRIDGKVNLWFRSGNLKETRIFKDGYRNGLWVSFNEAGGKTGEASYKDDLKDGTWKIWDDAGVLRYDMFYRKGQKSGLWIMYDSNGLKTSEKNYPDNK